MRVRRPALGDFRRTWLAAFAGVACALLVVAPVAASVVPTFNFASSSLSGTHDAGPSSPVVVGSPFTMPMALPPGGASLIAPFSGAGHTFALNGGGSTHAKAGAGHVQGANLAKITFPAGTGIDQTDPAHSTGLSTLQVDFTFTWDISGGTFGPPISAGFSVPVGAKVAAGGSATFDCSIQWNEVRNGVTTANARTPFSVSHVFGPGTTLTSFTAPAAVFSPSSIPDSAGTDQLIITGFLKFGANNDTAPVIVELLGQDPQSKDLTDFATELALRPDLQYESNSTFDDSVTPEPTGLAFLAAAPLLLLTRRRQVAPLLLE